MKQNKLFLGLATMFAAAFAFTSCSSEDLQSQNAPQKSGNEISFTYRSAAGTRTAEDPQPNNVVATGLDVGIFGVSSEVTTTMTHYANNKYVTAAAGVINLAEGSEAMTWPTTSEATASLYAYAPYNSTWEVNTANAFSVNSDQSTDENYLASDLLYAAAASQAQGSTVALAFSHKLSKINITIKKETGSNVNLAGATVKITNTKLTTSLNPTTGALGDASGDAIEITAATIAEDLEAGGESSTATACAVVVPQNLDAETAFVKIVTAGEDSKTLIGKLSAATTLEGGNSYSMTVSVGNVTEAVTEVPISLGTTSLVAWTNNNIGLTAYTVGDYVLTDGTFMKKTAYATASAADKAKVAGIIFSTTVSSTDAAAGYNAYAVGVIPYAGRTWNVVTTGDYQSTNVTTATTTLSAGIDDLNGKTKTAELMEKYYPSLTDTYKSSFVANLTGYSIALTGSNLSSWFLPSFGQMVLILNELGGTKITKTFIDGGDNISSGSAFYINGTTAEVGTTNPNLETLVSNLNTSFSVGGVNQFSTSNVNFSVSTENGGEGHQNKIWLVQFEDSKWKLTKGGNRNGNGKTVLPCIAIKNLPTVAE